MSQGLGSVIPEVGKNVLVRPEEMLGGGFPFRGSVVDNGLASLRPVRHYWVHGNLGSDSADGLEPSHSLKTMQAAFNKVGSGDVIHFNGNITENLTTPAGIFDVTIIGEGNRPRHADAHTTNNGYSAATWKASSQSDPLLTVQQQGWRLMNFLMDAPTSDACVDLIRNASSGDSERDGSHLEIIGLRLVGGQTGIQVTGTENLFNILIRDTIFQDLTNGIDSSGSFALKWYIFDNIFNDNTNHIDVGLVESMIKGNLFGLAATSGVDLTGGSNNMVTGNYFHGDFNVLNTAGTSDMWAGNFAEETGGVTDADPTGS